MSQHPFISGAVIFAFGFILGAACDHLYAGKIAIAAQKSAADLKAAFEKDRLDLQQRVDALEAKLKALKL